MLTSILGTSSTLIVFICLVLAIFLFLTRSERALANRLFGIFLILTAIDVSAWFWVGQDVSHSLLYASRESLGALQMPCFLGFIVASCYSDFKLDKKDWLHAIPFFIKLYLTLPGNQLGFLSASDSADTVYITDNEYVFNFALAQLQYYIYIAVAIYVLFRFKTVFRENYSDSRASVFSWLLQLVVVSLFAHSLVVIRGLIQFTTYQDLYSYLQVAGALLVLVIITWITFKALLQPELFRGIDRNEHKESKPTKTTKTQVSDDSTVELNKTNLIDYMQSEQAFLNAELTSKDLAAQVGLTQRELSELINDQFGMHFFDFINSYRIQLAKDKLLEDRSSTVLEILYAVGFNSKSSFNTAFKKHTQTTPTAFRRANAI